MWHDGMRTTLNLPTELLDEAQRVLGARSKTETVVLSLRELIRRKRIDELRSLLGSVTLDVDIAQSRRRPVDDLRRHVRPGRGAA